MTNHKKAPPTTNTFDDLTEKQKKTEEQVEIEIEESCFPGIFSNVFGR